jgi:hypothetical protein
MSGNTSENKRKGKAAAPPWYASGLDHLWLPYAQMKTVSSPLAVATTHGSRITLADGRELIDGIASPATAITIPISALRLNASLHRCRTSCSAAWCTSRR